jgi:hypothetical protein
MAVVVRVLSNPMHPQIRASSLISLVSGEIDLTRKVMATLIHLRLVSGDMMREQGEIPTV